jgi:hypothetical protein
MRFTRSHEFLTASAIVLLVQIFVCRASATAADIGKTTNCGPQKIHQDALILPTHGVDLHIYPNADVIGEQYSGCQNIWLDNGFLLAQAMYKNGVIQTYTGSEPDGKTIYRCIYKDKKLVLAEPTTEDCPPFEAFPLNKEGKAK